MNATEELRRLLDERGVGHEGGERSVRWRDRNGVMMQAFPLANGELGIEVWSCTPEQAIAATLGGEVGKTGRYAELFGTPERAAKTISTTAACVESETVCRDCEYKGYCGTACGYDTLLEWLRGDA